MAHRVYAALLGFLLACAPALGFSLSPAPALAQDLDDLMTSDPEQEEASDDDGGGGDESDDDEGGGDEGGGGGSGWDESGVDDERPPGDPTAFALPKEKKDDEVEEEDTGLPLSVGVLVGFGVNMKGDANPWGFGFGLQGGYDLGLVSVGLRFDYYLGETYEKVIPSQTQLPDVFDVSTNLWELGLEIGLDIDASDAVLIRPGLGFGLATVTTDSVSETQPYIAPGAVLLYSISPAIYLGFEARFQLVASDVESVSALIFQVPFGMRF